MLYRQTLKKQQEEKTLFNVTYMTMTLAFSSRMKING